MKLPFRKDEEEAGYGYSSTYSEMDEAPSWTHYGVGKKHLIPTVVPSLMFNVIYCIFLFAIMMGLVRLIWQVVPWVALACIGSIAGFSYWVKKKFEGIPVHRLGIYWGGPHKIILGDFLVDEDAQRDYEFSDIRNAAEHFARKGFVPLARSRVLKEAGKEGEEQGEISEDLEQGEGEASM